MPPRPSVLRRAVAIVVSVAAGLLLMLHASGPAAAHAVLVGTDPEDGTVLDAPPDQLSLTFNEPVQVVAGATSVLAADGSPVEVDVVAVNETVVVTPAAPLDDGTYVVSWRVISLDTHPVAGAFSFSVGAPSSTSADVSVAEPTTALITVRAAAQAAVYVGTFVVAGLVVFELVVLHVSSGAAPVLRRRLQRLRQVALAVAVVAAVLAVPLTAAWQAGAGLDALMGATTWTTGIASDTALASFLGIAGLVLATALAPRAGRETRSAWPAGLASGGAALALGALLIVGHTRTFGPPWLVLAADALHVGAGAIWLGGVLGLALTLARSAHVDPRRVAVTIARFSALGAWLVLTLALTGLVLGWRIIGTLEGLLTTAYGQILLVKIGVALLVVGIAAWNRYRLVPAMSAVAGRGSRAPGTTSSMAARRRLGRTTAAEAALLGVILATTGVLVSTSPEASAAKAVTPATAAVGPESVEVVADLGEGTVLARVTPGRVGVNALELQILAADGAAVQPLSTPELSVTLEQAGVGPLSRPLTETGPGEYEATLDLPLPGSWTVTVSVRQSMYENPVVQIPLEVTS